MLMRSFRSLAKKANFSVTRPESLVIHHPPTPLMTLLTGNMLKYMQGGANYCAQDGGNLSKAAYRNLNHSMGACVTVISKTIPVYL